MTYQSTSTAYPAPHSMQPHPQKDYEAAFGTLQSQYGFGLPTPPLPKSDKKTRKWYKWGESRSPSTTSLLQHTSRSDPAPPSSRHTEPTRQTLTESELRFGKLMEAYGHGPVSPASFNRR